MNRCSRHALHTIGSFRERINDPFISQWSLTSHLGVLINDGGRGGHGHPRYLSFGWSGHEGGGDET